MSIQKKIQTSNTEPSTKIGKIKNFDFFRKRFTLNVSQVPVLHMRNYHHTTVMGNNLNTVDHSNIRKLVGYQEQYLQYGSHAY